MSLMPIRRPLKLTFWLTSGMHALELAKTLWNLLCTEPEARLVGGVTEQQLQMHAKAAVEFAASVLGCFGPEGDEGGPLEEIRVLTALLNGN